MPASPQTVGRSAELPQKVVDGNGARLDQIPPEMLEQAWFWVSGLMKQAVDSADGELSIDFLRSEIGKAHMALWVASNPKDVRHPLAVMVTRLEKWEKELVLRIICVAGTDVDQWKHLMTNLENMARDRGVSRVKWEGRLGWKKLLPDYEMTRIVMEKRLV